MERSEQAGLVVAIIGHVVVFGLLSARFLAAPLAVKPLETPVQVSLVDDVALEAQAPPAADPPAQSRAPQSGKPQDASPPPPELAPQLAPPAPAKPVPPVPLKPAPVPKPLAKPAPQKPEPKAAPELKPPPRRPVAPDAKAPAKPQIKPQIKPVPQTKPTPASARPPTTPGNGAKAGATKARPTGSRLDDIFKHGLSDAPSASTKVAPPAAATIDGKALAGIQDAIRRQIQPCADRQVNPGPGANAIVTVLNLRLNRDGTLAGVPSVVRQSGTDSENERYAKRVIDLGIAAFKGCAPLKLPPEYYQTANGGWGNINYNWQLR